MVHPDYQKKGIGRMIVKKCSEIADASGIPTYVRARPTSKPLFESAGFRVLEDIKIDYGKEGVDSSIFVMKREVGGK